jgi:glucosamine--fructose-6-phosphate aminotransferase (isomerizing)
MLVISQSGETKDTHRALMQAEDALIPRFSVVNQVGSLIARTTKCGVYINAGREHAVASTKAFTTQVAALALVASWFSQNRVVSSLSPQIPIVISDRSGGKQVVTKGGAPHNIVQRRQELIDAIHRLPTYTGISLRTHEKCKQIAEKLKDQEHIFILGKGYAEPIAYEGALKIKEIGYVHAEGYSGGALKHGPFALLDKGTPIILLIFDDQNAELMRTAAHEVHARGSYNIVITDNPKLAQGIADDVVTVPSNGPLSALLAVVPLQLIAYELSLKKGINPDKPRHLAKAVTVD